MKELKVRHLVLYAILKGKEMTTDNQHTSHVSPLTSNVTEDEINLLDYWRILLKRKLFIAIIVVIAFIGSIIYSLLLPKIYSSTATLLPPQQEGSMGSNILSQLSGGLGGLAGGFLGRSTPSELWLAIIKSQTIKDAIIQRFDLMRVFKASTMDSARNDLDGMVKVVKSKEGIIAITVEDKDPRRAADMANALVEELDKVNKGQITTSGRKMRIFVEERLNGAKVDLARAEENIKAFQEKNKAVKLDDQSKAIIEAIGILKGNLMAKEVELQTLLSYTTPNNPMAEILKTEVDELKKRLQELEEGTNIPGKVSKNIFIPTNEIPGLSLQYVRLLRDAKVQQALYELLTQQYEMARIQEAKDTPTVQVLDTAQMPEERSRPKRTQIVLFNTITAAFFAIFAAFFMEYLEKTKKQRSTT